MFRRGDLCIPAKYSPSYQLQLSLFTETCFLKKWVCLPGNTQTDKKHTVFKCKQINYLKKQSD